MKKQALILASIFTISFVACDKEDVEENIIQNTSFTESELSILNQFLSLQAVPFNYANPTLPEHYKSGFASESDNTPEDNQITDMGATLGRVLFYDNNLSIDNTISCASCHQQSAAFSDNEQFSIGLNGQTTRRNSMGLINARYYANGHFFWDERSSTLEEQVLVPIQDHIEMGMDLASLEVKLQNLDYYNILFEKAFGSPDVTSDRIALALSQFIRSIVAPNSKFDEGLIALGNPPVEENISDFPNFTAQENLGMDIFLRGRNGGTCGYCHGSGINVNDEAKNNGLALTYTDKGKGEITGNVADNALFKVPSLRNIANTGPYMHDGRFATLMDVVDHYSDNVQQHPNLHFRLTTNEQQGGNPLRLNLTQEEKEALVAFLHTLTDHDVLTTEKYSDPFLP